jgi:hypothetical protein
MGVLAQEVEQVFPEFVETGPNGIRDSFAGVSRVEEPERRPQ